MGKAIVIATASDIQIWDIETGRSIEEELNPLQHTDAIARNDRGEIILAEKTEEKTTIWNLESGSQIATLPTATAEAIALSVDGKTLVAVSDKTAVLGNTNGRASARFTPQSLR